MSLSERFVIVRSREKREGKGERYKERFFLSQHICSICRSITEVMVLPWWHFLSINEQLLDWWTFNSGVFWWLTTWPYFQQSLIYLVIHLTNDILFWERYRLMKTYCNNEFSDVDWRQSDWPLVYMIYNLLQWTILLLSFVIKYWYRIWNEVIDKSEDVSLILMAIYRIRNNPGIQSYEDLSNLTKSYYVLIGCNHLGNTRTPVL